MKKLGIYIHIPFCKSKCGYCDFYSLENKDALMPTYQAALISHIRETAALTSDHVVDTVYFGGGTPTYFGEKRVISILNELGKKFSIIKDAEITLEANPESVSLKALKKLRRSGFNRISIGVQSASDEELLMLGRTHTYADAESAVGIARDAGFQNIGLDLLYGLPGQNVEGFLKSLDSIVALAPEHISCYGLKLEADAPLKAAAGLPDLPDDDRQADMYLASARVLDTAGYKQYEISNFSKPGRESRHNLKYWNSEEYIGFGPSAHSDLNGRRYSFIKSLDKYTANIKNGGSVVAEIEDIPKKERAGEYLMLRLRTSRGISADEYETRFRLPFDPLLSKLAYYADMGFTERDGDIWRLTPKGCLLSNRIIGDIMDSQSDKKLTFSDYAKIFV